MYSKEEMIKLPASFLCAVALIVHAFGSLYQDLQSSQRKTYRLLIISCAQNNYTNNTQKISNNEPPRDQKKDNPAPGNDQSGCIHSGTPAMVTTPQRFKRQYGKGSACSH